MKRGIITPLVYILTLLFIGYSYAANDTIRRKIDDTVITTKVKAQYAQDPLLNPLNIKVETKRGIVYLSGSLDTDMQYQQAITLAEQTDNVKDIDANQLAVKNSPSPLSDTLITAKIKGLILRDKTIKDATTGSDISVETKNAVVYLSGTVNSMKQKNHVIELAKSVKGVKNINDHLQTAS